MKLHTMIIRYFKIFIYALNQAQSAFFLGLNSKMLTEKPSKKKQSSHLLEPPTPIQSSNSYSEILIEKNKSSRLLEPPTPNFPANIRDEAPPAALLTDTQSFWAHLDSFLKTQNSQHTQRAYEKDLVDFFGYIKATQNPMTVHTLVAYRDLLKNRVSERTGSSLSHVSINRKIATIKSFLNWLVLNGVLPNNPAKAVKSFRAGRESPTRDISDDMVRRMLSLPHRHRIAGRMHHAILTLLFHLGLRRTELVSLRTSDLFEQEGMRVIRVRGKGDKDRVLPLTPEIIHSLETYLEMAKKSISVDQPLFSPVKNNITKEKNKPLHPNAIAYIVKHYAKLAGISYRVSPHSARATAVSNALDNHAPHRSVQHMAGWSSPLMVTRYDKRKQDLKNSAVRFVNYSSEKLS